MKDPAPELENAAAAYERLLAPALFHQWTHQVVDAARIAVGQRVLDVACGTGQLARVASARVGPQGSVAAVDVNRGMLKVAATLAPEIEWYEASAESLPFADESFDAVVSQFGLMFFDDRAVALREMNRVLRPGGHLAVAVFDSPERVEAYGEMARVFERNVGKDVGSALRYPFSLGDVDELRSLFAEADMPNAQIESRLGAGRFASVEQMVMGDVAGWFPVAGIEVDERSLSAVVEDAGVSLRRFVKDDGSVEFPLPVHIVIAGKGS